MSPIKEDIKQKVFDIIATNLGVDRNTLTLETTFTEDLGADSLDLTELVMQFEEDFSFAEAISETDAEGFKTVGDVYEYILSKAK